MNIYIFGGVAGAGFADHVVQAIKRSGYLVGYMKAPNWHTVLLGKQGIAEEALFFSVLKEEGAFVKLVGG